MNRLDDRQFEAVMDHIVSALREKGYDPYEQLLGYRETEYPAYITRHRNARKLIQFLELEKITKYMQDMVR